jgi:hypothetical protein
MSTDDYSEKDIGFEQALESVLGFYGTQLQSHAATIVSLAIGFFALIALRPSGEIGIILFTPIASVLTVVIAYSFLRLVAYGLLSASILYGNFGNFASYRTNYRSMKDHNWALLFPNTKVSYYANSFFLEHGYIKKYLGLIEGKWIFGKNAQPRRSFLLIIGLVSVVISLLFSAYG